MGGPGLALREVAREARALTLGGILGARDVFANLRLRAERGRAFSAADAGEAAWRRAARGRRGRLAVVTGANAGVGLALAQLLTARGVHVILGCRSPERGRAALAAVRAAARGGARAELLALDLCDGRSVHAFSRAVRARCGHHRPLDLVVANAGVMATPWARTPGAPAAVAGGAPGPPLGGLESQWAANFAGHFLLVRLLWPALGADARVLLLSSVAHHGGFRPDELRRLAADCAPRAPRAPTAPAARGAHRYSPYAAYKRSKWAMAALAPELQRRAATGAQVVCAVHPGLVDTALAFGFFRRFVPAPLLRPLQSALLRTPADAARAVLAALALPPETAAGAYVVDGRVERADRVIVRSAAARAAVWDVASAHVGLPAGTG